MREQQEKREKELSTCADGGGRSVRKFFLLQCNLQLSSLVGTFSLIRSDSLVHVSDPLLFIADWDSLLPKSI